MLNASKLLIFVIVFSTMTSNAKPAAEGKCNSCLSAFASCRARLVRIEEYYDRSNGEPKVEAKKVRDVQPVDKENRAPQSVAKTRGRDIAAAPGSSKNVDSDSADIAKCERDKEKCWLDNKCSSGKSN